MYHNIAVLPMDSRPCSSDFVSKIGRIGGYSVLCPPLEWYREFLKESDTARLAQWVREAAEQVDYLVVSVDMLLFGGLATAMRHYVPLETAMERLELLRELREAHPSLRIYAAFAIPGSSNSVYTPKELVDRSHCMSYSQLSYKIRLYDREEDKEALDELMEIIDRKALDDYIKVRERARAVSLKLVEFARDGVVDFLSLGVNDSSLYGLHRLRIQELVTTIYDQGVADRAVVYAGTDEQCQALLVRAMLAHQKKDMRFFLRYSCCGAETFVPAYEYMPMGDNFRLLLYTAGCIVVDSPQEADVILMVNSPCQSWDDYRTMEKNGQTYFLPESQHDLWDFVSGINYYLRTGRRVAVADTAFINGCDIGLVRFMQKSVDLTKLTAFGGWNTVINTFGTVIAQAAARTLFDMSETQELESERTHIEFLMERFADEYCYQSVARPQVNKYVSEKGGAVVNLGEMCEETNALVVETMTPLVNKFFEEQFKGRSLNGKFSDRKIVSVTPNIRLPGPRTFEVWVDTPFVTE